MLEFFAIYSLCRVNKRNAIARGRKPGGYIALTIVLWVVMEIIGMIVGNVLQYAIFGEPATSGLNFFVIIVTYSIAGIGALISFLCAKFAPRGDYVDPSTISTPPVMTSYNVPSNMPAYMVDPKTAPVQPQEYVHVDNPYQAPSAPAVRYCESCGSQVRPGASYCSTCGAKIDTN